MNPISRMKELIPKILDADTAYYKLDAPVLSDREYDQLYGELLQLERDTGIILGSSPTQKTPGELLEGLAEVRHTRPMLSAAKTKSVENLMTFIGGRTSVLSWKLDGLTLVLRYEGGALRQAITRGREGLVGEDVTHTVRHMRNVPRRIPCKEPLEVRGEGVISWANFQTINPFNEIISQAAFDGTICETDLSSTSPEFGTDGYYAKCWVREEGCIQLYKGGSDHYEIEPLSEYLAAQLAAELCPGAVAYDMDYYHGKLISKCPLFTSETVGLAKASAVFGGAERTIPELLDFFAGIGGEDAFRRMCVLDALILNVDRLYGNFGVLFDTATMETLGMAPVFDHNRSLLPALDNDQLAAPEWYLRKCRPRLGTDFLLTARGLLTDDIRRDLKRLGDFTFRQHPRIRAEQERLDSLSKIVQNQIHQILST